jgi:hypothetical protein
MCVCKSQLYNIEFINKYNLIYLIYSMYIIVYNFALKFP